MTAGRLALVLLGVALLLWMVGGSCSGSARLAACGRQLSVRNGPLPEQRAPMP